LLSRWGETYVPGEQIKLTISDMEGMVLWEASTDDLAGVSTFADPEPPFTDRTCTLAQDGHSRAHSVNGIVVTAPSDGSTLVLKSVWATGNGVNVYVHRMVLNAPSATTVSVADQASLQLAAKASNTVASLAGDIALAADDPACPFGPTGLYIASVQVSAQRVFTTPSA